MGLEGKDVNDRLDEKRVCPPWGQRDLSQGNKRIVEGLRLFKGI